jgi:hypothetical protein
MERNPKNNDQRDRQLQRLAGQLRDMGTTPNRDLWPDINAALDRQDNRPGQRESRRRGGTWLRMTAVAAALTLMLAAGWVGIRSINGDSITGESITGDLESPDGVAGNEDQPSGLAVIDQALDELTLALTDDPENRNLSHLVLMVHKTRGNLLRRTSDNLLRD